MSKNTTNLSHCFKFFFLIQHFLGCKTLTIFQSSDGARYESVFFFFFNVSVEGWLLGAAYSAVLLRSLPILFLFFFVTTCFVVYFRDQLFPIYFNILS